jgi:hypothetical protein
MTYRLPGGRTLAGAALVLLSACAAGAAPAEPDLGPVPTVTDAAQLNLPLDAYRMTGKEYVTVRRATWRLVKACVDRYGGEYTMKEAEVVDDVPMLDRLNDRRYGVFDAEGAAVRGYNAPPEYRGRSREKKAGWDPSAAEELLVTGVAPATVGGTQETTAGPVARPTDREGRALPEDGCTGEAGRALVENAPAPANPDLGEQLGRRANKQAEGDRRVREATGRWSECMKSRGYDYPDIWAPNDRDWPEPAGDVEIGTARADVACKVETNFVGVMLAAESAYQRLLIEQNAEALAAVQTDLRARSANAAELVGAS